MSVDRLAGVHPELVGKVRQIQAAMAALGQPMLVTDGLRTTAQQQQLYALGRTVPGKIVTQCDGLRSRSKHQAHPSDGLGHAVDLCFLVDDKPSWSDALPWDLYGRMAELLGLTWGGRWASFPDKPHLELPLRTP